MRDSPSTANAASPNDMAPLGEGPLVPLLRAGEDPADPLTLVTWYEALSSALAADVPHDLFAFWLYPASGGAVLLAPEALAADALVVPEPPSVSRDQLALLEELVEGAGYRSTICVTSVYRGTDVGLLMFANLAAGAHGPRERAAAQLAADALAPSLGSLARRWREGGVRPLRRTDAEVAAIMTAAAAAASNARTPRELSRALSAALAGPLPHDRLELLVPGASAEQWYRIGEHPGGPLWGDPDLIVSGAGMDLVSLVERQEPIVLSGLPGEPLVFPPAADAPSARSALGVRLAMSDRAIGCLLLSSADDHRYGEEDATLLERIAAVVASRVDAFVMAGHLQVLRGHVAAQRSLPSRMARVLETLATVSDPAEATRRIESEASAMIGFDELWFALVLGDPSRVAMLRPGERRPLPDLPQVATGETPLGRVVRGESSAIVADQPGRTDLIVALRVAGRVIGAMMLVTRQEGMFDGSDEDTARGLAAAVAPWLELLRREAMAPPPMVPGWKRTPRR
ncbi:MAG: GAF domain-containing protein [Gemmatimonadota bacterium]